MHSLIDALLDGDQEKAVVKSKMLLDQGHNREAIVKDGIEATMKKLDAKCTAESFNLLEIMLTGRAVMAVMQELYSQKGIEPAYKGTIVVGALEGDMHDLGKNILKMILTANSYRVIDCGKDCAADTMLDTARKNGAHAIAISALLTTIIPQLRLVKPKAEEMGLQNIKIIAGGGALHQTNAESVNVDYIGITAFDGVRYLDNLAGVES